MAGHWNYRVIQGKDAAYIAEVYYKNGKPVACTDPIELILEPYSDEDSVTELRKLINIVHDSIEIHPEPLDESIFGILED